MDPTIITPDSVTVNTTGDVHNITVTADADMVTYTLTDGETYTEVDSPEGNYTFTITAKDTYQIDSVKYKVGATGTEKELTAKSDGTYSIPKSEITDDVAITVTASKIQYTVTPTVTVDNSIVSDFVNNATISFSTTPTGNKVDAGSSLTISASLKDTAKATHKITKVAYTMGSDEEVDLTENWNGSTTISNVSGNVAITVTVTALETYKVSFSNHANIKEVAEIKVNDAAYDPAKFDSTTTSDWEISATEGSTVSFKLVADEKFQVTEVTDGGQTAVTPVAGVYTIENLSANVALSIKTGLTTAANGFSFAMETGSDKGSATMTVEPFTDDADIVKGLDSVAGVYNAGESALTLNEKIVVSFTAKAGYELGDVKLDGTTVTPTTEADLDNGTPAKYEVTLEAGKSRAITVATDAKGSEAEKSFVITNSAAHMTLGAVEADGTAIALTEGKYLAAAGKKRITFSVTADGAYEPGVTAVTNAAEEGGEPTKKEIEAVEVATASGKTTYKYLVLASQLADEYTITEKQAVKTISFTGTDNVDVSIDGRLTNVSSPVERVQGRKLTVRVMAKENATLKSVKYKVGDANEVNPKVSNNASEFQVTLTENATVTIDATGALKALPLKDAENNVLTPVKNVYNVSYDKTYTAAIVEGIQETPVTPTEAKLYNGNTEITEADGQPKVVAIKNATAEVNLGNADVTAVSGKKLTLKVTVGTGEDAKTFAYTLQVSKAIAAASDITVPANAKQPTDTVKTYAVKTKGEINRLHARVAEADITAGYIKSAEIEGDKLVITTGQTVTPAAGVKVTVYTGTGENEISKDVLVKTTALISDTTAAPKVTLKSATDIDLTLSLSAKTDADVAAGSVYYKVTATATGTVPAGLESTVTKYVAKTGDAQDYTLNVASDGTVLGKGSACDYKVTVSLIHAKDKSTTLTAANEADQKVAESKAFETAANKPFSTQNPAWEANLKLKKGKTTIYTGEEDVVIATPQFTKTTTYTEITKGDITDCTQTDGNGLEFEVENGVIKASASADTTVGKHTVQVVALADNAVGGHSMVASKATIIVTVVKGINTLGVSVPATSMYKAVNKTATLKATPVYNGDASGKNKTLQPKTKKVKWELVEVAQSHNPETDVIFGGGKVTINKNNGTVTVAKDYVIKADSDENKFQIRVMVDNANIGDAPVAYSDPIEITNEGLDMNRLVLVDSNDNVLAISNESKPKGNPVPVAATALNGAEVKVLTAGADAQTVGKTYTNNAAADTELSYTDMSYKSSKAKDVGFSTENNKLTLTVAKANTQPTLTVTANDGSKAALAIKLKVDYDTPAGELALKITDAEKAPIYDPATNGATVTQSYTGSATNMLFAELMQKKDGSWEDAEDYVNYDIKVTNGKKVSQEGTTALITTDKAEVKIELTDKSKTSDNKTTYTLTNSNFVASGAKVKAKVIGSLRQVAEPSEQDVKLELEIPTELVTSLSGDGKTAAVEVGVDWAKASLKNGKDLADFEASLEKTVYDIGLEDLNATTKKATVQLVFDSDSAVESYNQKNYALKVSVGSKANNDGKFTPAAPAVAATLKVEKTKKFTFKPTTSYTIATRDGGAVITGKASIPTGDYELEDLELLNANFGGKANEFTKYFKISNGKLMINDGITATDINDLLSNKDYKNHLTGYLTYNATTDKSYYEKSTGTGTNTVKITVKLNDTKPVAKYTAASAEIMNKANETVEVAIQANKADVTIKHAMFDTTGTKTDASIDTTAALVSNGKISLKLKEAVAASKKSIKATVYVIPEDSYYLNEFEGEGKNPTLDTYKQYGAAVTITLKVVQPKTMTLAEAKAAVTEWVTSVTEAETAPDWLTNKDATEASMKQTIIDEAKKAIVADNAAAFTVAYAKKADVPNDDDFTFSAASTSGAGMAKGTLAIKLGEDSETVAFEFAIPKLEDEQQPEVTGVTITAPTANANVEKGSQVTCAATVEGNKLTEDQKGVTWTIETTDVDSGTAFTNNVLTVSENESQPSITLKATSVQDTTKSATVTINITEPTS